MTVPDPTHQDSQATHMALLGMNCLQTDWVLSSTSADFYYQASFDNHTPANAEQGCMLQWKS